MDPSLKKELEFIALELELLQENIKHLVNYQPGETTRIPEGEKEFNGFDRLRFLIDQMEKSGAQVEGASMSSQTCIVGVEGGALKREPTGKCLMKIFYTQPK